MELALSFDAADASRIEKYAAEKNMSVPDFVRRAVMKSVHEEQERAARNGALLALKKLQKELEGAGEKAGLGSDEAIADWITESRRRERSAV